MNLGGADPQFQQWIIGSGMTLESLLLPFQQILRDPFLGKFLQDVPFTLTKISIIIETHPKWDPQELLLLAEYEWKKWSGNEVEVYWHPCLM